jgi:2-polyprenyl-6-methoxyphenol hydroxylase-like FAD-dependent oxidoreductase
LLTTGQYGCELVNISEGPQRTIQAAFRKDEIASGTIILGADGAGSKVRELLLGPEKATITPVEIGHASVAVKYIVLYSSSPERNRVPCE